MSSLSELRSGFSDKSLDELFKIVNDSISILDSVNNYKNYSRSRIDKMRCKLNILQLSSIEQDGRFTLTQSIGRADVLDICEILVFEDIFRLIQVEKQSNKNTRGLDSSVRQMLDDSKTDFLNHQVALQLGGVISYLNGYEVIGFDDLFISTPSGLRISFECKRPLYSHGIHSNIDKAVRQLTTKRYGDYGVPVICIDNICAAKPNETPLIKIYSEVENLISTHKMKPDSFILGVIVMSNHADSKNTEDAVKFRRFMAITDSPLLSSVRSVHSPDIKCLQQIVSDIVNSPRNTPFS